jgi:hypothetical protein
LKLREFEGTQLISLSNYTRYGCSRTSSRRKFRYRCINPTSRRHQRQRIPRHLVSSSIGSLWLLHFEYDRKRRSWQAYSHAFNHISRITTIVSVISFTFALLSSEEPASTGGEDTATDNYRDCTSDSETIGFRRTASTSHYPGKVCELF